MKDTRAERTRSEAHLRKTRSAPKTVDYSAIEFDIFKDLLSFYYRSVGLALNRDYDLKIARVSLARGTGKVSTLLLVAANPGIRPSILHSFDERVIAGWSDEQLWKAYIQLTQAEAAFRIQKDHLRVRPAWGRRKS